MVSPARVVVPKPWVLTVRSDLVEEPTAKAVVSPATGFTESRANGEVVPTPTYPLPETRRCGVVVPESDTTNTGWFVVVDCSIENMPHGVVEPKPIDVEAIPPTPFDTEYRVSTGLPSICAV